MHASPRSDTHCRVYSELLDEQYEFDLAALPAPDALPRGFIRYVAGVAWALQQHTGRTLTGIEATISSELPIGAGLSSSAALEAAFALLWNTLDNLGLERLVLAQLCQQAEHVYAGVHCGVMDQVAALLSEAGCALFVDTRTLFTQSIALPRDWAIVVADTGVPRTLAESAYNQRRAQCEEAVVALRPCLGRRYAPCAMLAPSKGRSICLCCPSPSANAPAT